MKYILNILILLLLVGCKKDVVYTGDIPEEQPFDPIVIEPQPIIMNVGDNSEGVSFMTKGYGGFNQFTSTSQLDSLIWRNADFYVYAFSKSADADYTVGFADERNDSVRYCLIDAGRTDISQSGKGGMLTSLNMMDMSSLDVAVKSGEESPVMYYNTYDYNYPYDFFIYYLDDIEISDTDIHRSKDHIYIDIETDGMRDFMGAKALLTESQKKIIERSSAGDILKESCFSTFSANYMINPVFMLSHYMTKLRFKIYPGGKISEDALCYNNIVDRISVVSKTKGRITVASNDLERYPLGIDFSGSGNQTFLLREKYIGNDGFLADSVSSGRLVYREEDELYADPYDRQPFNMGGCFLLPPQEEYDIVVSLRSINGGREDVDLKITPPDGKDTFYSGEAYVIRLAIFGNMEIGVDIDVAPWKDSDHDFDINPDAPEWN